MVAPTGRAFTLIEVLVVVAIIALLVAILLPSLRRARDQAKVVACRANLHDFGISMQQYTDANRGYYPLVCYVGTRIYEDDPTSDDNLLLLWLGRYTRNLNVYTCPATVHKVRPPERIEKVDVPGLGVRYDVYTDGELRNDFEFHGQLVRQKYKTGETLPVHLNGTSYELKTWTSSLPGETRITWYPLNAHKSRYEGGPRRVSVRNPATTFLMKDADEGGGGRGDVVGAPPGAATNNIPEPWDNHGKQLANELYPDGHVVARPYSYWVAQAKAKGMSGY
ncbi:MAG: hypothetical protein AMXMBFR83_20510 [Phycisphaerae bacterium]|jgi:prepilin-type N-terminal cleavage/methylation domain-containing protein